MNERVRLTETQEARIILAVKNGIIEDMIKVEGAIMDAIEKMRAEQSIRHARGAMDALSETVPNLVVRKQEGASLDVDAALNRWQGLAQSAQGNIARITKEIQKYLVEGVLPTKKQ